jgi:hypothetical protein
MDTGCGRTSGQQRNGAVLTLFEFVGCDCPGGQQNASSRDLGINSDERLFEPASPVAPNRRSRGENHIFAPEFAAHATKPRD